MVIRRLLLLGMEEALLSLEKLFDIVGSSSLCTGFRFDGSLLKAPAMRNFNL